MKTQCFGLHKSQIAFCLAQRFHSELSFFARGSLEDFKNKRQNGETKDNPKDLAFEDGDGVYYDKSMGHDDLGEVYFVYEVRYDAGPKDLAYFEAKDRNYLARILKEGKLRELEPDVWCLRELDHAQDGDIGEWWSQKLKLPNIGTLLENAENLYAIATSWQEAPVEICELIAHEFPFDLSSPKI